MIPDDTYTAVVDRVEDGLATLELTAAADADETDDSGGSERRRERHELVVDPETLPPDARRADAVLRVTVRDGDLADATYDETETEDRAESAQDRFDRLSKRPPGDDSG